MSAPEASASRSHTQRFRRHSRTPALSTDQKRRQAVVTDAAWRTFRAGGAMAAYLNGYDAALGARPLDLAINGDDGLALVLDALRSIDQPQTSSLKVMADAV